MTGWVYLELSPPKPQDQSKNVTVRVITNCPRIKMGQKIAKKLPKKPKSPKWQKTPIGPRRHVAKPGEAGRSVVTSDIII